MPWWDIRTWIKPKNLLKGAIVAAILYVGISKFANYAQQENAAYDDAKQKKIVAVVRDSTVMGETISEIIGYARSVDDDQIPTLSAVNEALKKLETIKDAFSNTVFSQSNIAAVLKANVATYGEIRDAITLKDNFKSVKESLEAKQRRLLNR